MEQWTTLEYLQAGAYIAIMFAVLGVPQMLSGYFDIRERRRERQEAEASAERHRDEAERRRQERYQEEQRRRDEAERRRDEADRHREERHQEVMTMLAALVSNGANQNQGQEQSDVIRTLQQVIEDLRAENARLRSQNGKINPADEPDGPN